MKYEDVNDNFENQEIWGRFFFNGYFFIFLDTNVNVQIEIEGSDKCDRILIFPGINDKDGKIDLTQLFNNYIHHIKENPGKKVSVFLTSFSRQMHFNKDLLSASIPQSILDLFKNA